MQTLPYYFPKTDYSKYAHKWLSLAGSRAISLSLPLREQTYEGDIVYNFFDNLLPDNQSIRDSIQQQFQTVTNQPFDLLSSIGMESNSKTRFAYVPNKISTLLL